MLNNRLPSRKVIGLLAVISLIAMAGCLTPPSPPEQNESTPRPDPSPYVESGAGINFDDVYESHYEQLNQSEGFAVKYNVSITDPRQSSSAKEMQQRYLLNTRQNETLYQSDFTGINKEVYKNSVLYYTRTGGESTQSEITVVPISEVQDDEVTMANAAGNSSVVRTGMSSSPYTLGTVEYDGNEEVSTYTASQSVSNYDVDDLIPASVDYQFGNPEIASGSESISSEIVMTRDGLMKEYTFTYTASMFVNGNEEEYEINITYTVERYGESVTVEQPGWVQNASQSSS